MRQSAVRLSSTTLATLDIEGLVALKDCLVALHLDDRFDTPPPQPNSAINDVGVSMLVGG